MLVNVLRRAATLLRGAGTPPPRRWHAPPRRWYASPEVLARSPEVLARSPEALVRVPRPAERAPRSTTSLQERAAAPRRRGARSDSCRARAQRQVRPRSPAGMATAGRAEGWSGRAAKPSSPPWTLSLEPEKPRMTTTSPHAAARALDAHLEHLGHDMQRWIDLFAEALRGFCPRQYGCVSRRLRRRTIPCLGSSIRTCRARRARSRLKKRMV